MNLISVIKEMKGKGTWYGMINKHDMISFTRSRSFCAITVMYDINNQSKKRVESYDCYGWQGIEQFLRNRFDYYCNRKEG